MLKETCLFCGRVMPGKQPTNGDTFRVMSDEELAVTLMCPNEMGMADIPCDHSDGKTATSACWTGSVSLQGRPCDEDQSK